MKIIKITIITGLIIESLLAFYSAHVASLNAEIFRYGLDTISDELSYFQIYTDQAITFLIVGLFSALLSILLSITLNK